MRVESQLVSVRRHRGGAWPGRIAMLALWLSGAAIFAGVGHLGEATVGCWTPLALLAGTSILLAVQRGTFAGAGGRFSPGRVVVHEGRIEVTSRGRTRGLRLDDVVSGWTEPEGAAGVDAVVFVTRDGTEVHVGCPLQGQADEVLHAVGVAPDQRAVRIRLRPAISGPRRAAAIFAAMLAGIVAVASFLVSFVSLLFALQEGLRILVVTGINLGFSSLMFLLARHFAVFSTTLSIGTDGVVVERALSLRLIRRADLGEVAARAGGLVIGLRSGRSLTIPASKDAALAVVERIRAALRATPGRSTYLAWLDRGGRPAAAWIAELRAQARRTQGYRDAALAVAELIDVVKDGAAPAEQRIAAAVALSGQEDEESRAALRAAVDTCVDDRLRDALSRAGELPDEEIAEAIAEISRTR
jgi:hypothetical protein